MTDDVLRVTNSEGRSFNVKLVRPGDPDLHSERGLWQNPTKPVVEFYDAIYESDPRFGPLGQFTAGRYYIADLLEHPRGMGLVLHGGVSAWRLDEAAIIEVQEWLRARCIDVSGGRDPGR